MGNSLQRTLSVPAEFRARWSRRLSDTEIRKVASLPVLFRGAGQQQARRRTLMRQESTVWAEMPVKDEKPNGALGTAILLALILTLHNLPEGLAVTISSSEAPSMGFTVMVAIALHNIPEGICVAMPAFKSTGDRWYALRLSVYSGLSEPLGAEMSIFLLGDRLAAVGEHVMAGVGGMMCAVSVCELL